MGGSEAWFALEPVRRPRGRLRRVETHVYATLLTATRRPGALSPTRLSPTGTGRGGSGRTAWRPLPGRGPAGSGGSPAAPASAKSPGTRTRSRPPGYRDPTAVCFPARRGSTGRPRRVGCLTPETAEGGPGVDHDAEFRRSPERGVDAPRQVDASVGDYQRASCNAIGWRQRKQRTDRARRPQSLHRNAGSTSGAT
jgi:hypothetical protein